MIKFRIFGVKIEISFLLICLLTLVLVNYGEFVLFWCIFSALFHELCHIVCLYYFGSKPVSLKFQINGIILNSKTELKNSSNIIVLSAGCIGNFILFLLFYLIKFKFAMIVNICLLVFNLLPYEKFDGGQLLEIALKKFDAATSLSIANFISNFFYSLLMILSIIFIFEFKNYIFIFFVIMLKYSN